LSALLPQPLRASRARPIADTVNAIDFMAFPSLIKT
jgi:hypothetical protein